MQFDRSLLVRKTPHSVENNEKTPEKLRKDGEGPHPGFSPNGGEPLLVLVGLHFVLSSPGRQVEGGHHRYHLLEARGRQRHGDGRRRGQGQAHGPPAHRDGLREAGELHRAPFPDGGVQRRELLLYQILGIVQFCFSQGFQQYLPEYLNSNLCAMSELKSRKR